jgi:hypothetical protein
MAESPMEMLERWEEEGAVWRPFHLSDELAVIDLCTCTGEPVERIESDDAQLIDWVRARVRSGEPS